MCLVIIWPLISMWLNCSWIISNSWCTTVEPVRNVNYITAIVCYRGSQPCWNLLCAHSQEPWPSLPPLLLWALLLPEGPLSQRRTLSAGCPRGGSQGACQSSSAGGSSQLNTGLIHRPASVPPVELINRAMLYVKGMTCVGSRSSCQYMLHMHKSYIYIYVYNIEYTQFILSTHFLNLLTLHWNH